MYRSGVLVLAAFLLGVVALGPLGTPAVAASGMKSEQVHKNRKELARKYNRKLPACKAAADRKKLIFSARREFIRKCLRQ